MINIGERIKDELDRQERTISWLARKLNRNRAAVYRLLKKNSIDTNVLSQISLLLGRDFFKELSQEVSDKRIDEKLYTSVTITIHHFFARFHYLA